MTNFAASRRASISPMGMIITFILGGVAGIFVSHIFKRTINNIWPSIPYINQFQAGYTYNY